MNIENKDKIIEGMKSTLKLQAEKIERHEKALREILSITEDTPELEVYTCIVKQALKED